MARALRLSRLGRDERGCLPARAGRVPFACVRTPETTRPPRAGCAACVGEDTARGMRVRRSRSCWRPRTGRARFLERPAARIWRPSGRPSTPPSVPPVPAFHREVPRRGAADRRRGHGLCVRGSTRNRLRGRSPLRGPRRRMLSAGGLLRRFRGTRRRLLGPLQHPGIAQIPRGRGSRTSRWPDGALSRASPFFRDGVWSGARPSRNAGPARWGLRERLGAPGCGCATAVHHGHQRGVIFHRDLKPAGTFSRRRWAPPAAQDHRLRGFARLGPMTAR
jgi:hypothetical protein